MATDSFADAVASFRYLRNNAMTPVHIRKKDITAPIISSRSSLRKSGSIKLLSTHEPPPICTLIFPQRARKHDPVTPSIRGPQCWRIQGECARLAVVDER